MNLFIFLGISPDAYGVSSSRLRCWHNTTLVPKKQFKFPRLTAKLKNNLPQLKSFVDPTPSSFWEKFPHRPIPNNPTTPIDIDKFKALASSVWHHFSTFQARLCSLVLDDLQLGADPLVNLNVLPGLVSTNPVDLTDLEVCNYLTDSIASWVSKGFVSGPFDDPPFANFRVNPIFACIKRGKVRPILNLSHPEGASFNDSILESDVFKINTSTPRQVADRLLDLGTGAVMSKLDMSNAFKLIPVHPRFWRIQGFTWLGKFFFETQVVFGSSSGPSIFDRLHEIFLLIARIISKTFSPCFFRVLDDFVCVTSTVEENKNLIDTYVNMADHIGLPLAPLDDPEKAFRLASEGVILGIAFRSTDNHWRIPKEKADHHICFLQTLVNKKSLDLEDLQSTTGILGSTKSMIPVLRSEFAILKQACKNAISAPVVNNGPIRKNIFKAIKVIEDLKNWTPITNISIFPSLHCYILVSDAAGQSKDPTLSVGVGGIAYLGNVNNSFHFQHIAWPKDFINGIDTAKIAFRHKTTLLEALGIASLVIHLAPTLKNQAFRVKVDNMATVFAFQKGRSKTDPYATTIVAALRFFLSQLNAKMEVDHLPRISDKAAIWADHLSRFDDKGEEKYKEVSHVCSTSWPPSLARWLSAPSLDPFLGEHLWRDTERCNTK